VILQVKGYRNRPMFHGVSQKITVAQFFCDMVYMNTVATPILDSIRFSHFTYEHNIETTSKYHTIFEDNLPGFRISRR